VLLLDGVGPVKLLLSTQSLQLVTVLRVEEVASQKKEYHNVAERDEIISTGSCLECKLVRGCIAEVSSKFFKPCLLDVFAALRVLPASAEAKIDEVEGRRSKDAGSWLLIRPQVDKDVIGLEVVKNVPGHVNTLQLVEYLKTNAQCVHRRKFET